MSNIETAAVVVVKQGVVFHSLLLQGEDREKVFDRVEQEFMRLCREHIHECREFSDEDFEPALDDGYIEDSNNVSVCITWPENVILVTSE